MRILLSGAAGFIGSHLSDRLIADGHHVVGLDNLLSGNLRNIAHLESEPRFAFRHQDVSQPFQAEGTFDAVLHLASPASPKDYLDYPVETLLVGSVGTRNMLECPVAGNSLFLLTSTSECYGDPTEHPQRETYWGNVNPVGPRSCYDESKRFAEAITMAYHRRFGLRTRIARIFNTYGPRMKLNDGRVVPAFLDQALHGVPITVFGDGSQTRSFCYVSDLVDGLIRLLHSQESYPVNIGNPQEMTMREFAEYIQELTGTPSPIEFHPLPEDDPKRRQPDITRAKTLLGWEPKVALREGLTQTIAYFQSTAD
ncbi:MAG: SDR family oxidoreductase [Bryobacterales bacterium]|nr:SDR family oxidoreductase [Bryobacterales bacterium]